MHDKVRNNDEGENRGWQHLVGLERWYGLLCRCLIVCLGLGVAAPSAMAEQLIESRESLYNNIFVYKDHTYVTMTFGYNKRIYTESRMNLADRAELPVPYTRYMTVALAYVSRASDLAMIGLGGGRTSQYLHDFLSDARIDVVELDPDVVALARKHFDLREDSRYRVHTLDGRLFLRRVPRAYDIVLVDAYRGPFVPFHLLTREFYELLRSRLKAGGVMVQNVEPSTMLFDSAIATMRAVFDQVDMYPAGGNVVVVAYDGSRRSDKALLDRASQVQQQAALPYALPDLVNARRHLTSPLDGKVLTDDFAPANMLKAIEQRNRKWR